MKSIIFSVSPPVNMLFISSSFPKSVILDEEYIFSSFISDMKELHCSNNFITSSFLEILIISDSFFFIINSISPFK